MIGSRTAVESKSNRSCNLVTIIDLTIRCSSGRIAYRGGHSAACLLFLKKTQRAWHRWMRTTHRHAISCLRFVHSDKNEYFSLYLSVFAV